MLRRILVLRKFSKNSVYFYSHSVISVLQNKLILEEAQN